MTIGAEFSCLALAVEFSTPRLFYELKCVASQICTKKELSHKADSSSKNTSLKVCDITKQILYV